MHQRLPTTVRLTADVAHEGIGCAVRAHVLEEQASASEDQMAVRAGQGRRRMDLLHVSAEAAEGGVDASAVWFPFFTASANRAPEHAVLTMLKRQKINARQHREGIKIDC